MDNRRNKRVQSELDLNPLNLTPTITSGGNYRVHVQDTPKTNAAMVLAQNLKQGVSAYGQVVGINQRRAAEDVASMSNEEWEKKLTEGLDEDAKSLFGYTKAYNRALAQKYYAEEIPSKLQDVSASMFKDYYEYTDAASFEGALREKTAAVYEEAEQLLGANAFGAEANQALKNATETDFVVKERQKFLSELPKRLQQLEEEGIGRVLADIGIEEVDNGSLQSSLDGAYKNAVGTLGARGASAALASSFKTKLDTLITSKDSSDHRLAEHLLDEIGDGKDFKVGAQDMFATADNQRWLTELETRLENRKDTLYADAQKEAQLVLTPILAELYNANETDRKQLLEDKLNEIDADDKLSSLEKDLISIELNRTKHNSELFLKEHVTNYIGTNNTQKKNYSTLVFDSIPETDLNVSGLDGKIDRNDPYSEKADEYITQATQILDDLYKHAYEQVRYIIDPVEKVKAFTELENTTVKDGIKTFVKEFWETPSATKAVEDAQEQEQNRRVLATAYGDEQANTYMAAFTPHQITALVKDASSDIEGDYLNGSGMPKGFSSKTQLKNYENAATLGLFENEEKQSKALRKLQANIHGSDRGLTFRNIDPALNDFTSRMKNGVEFKQQVRTVGIPLKELISGTMASSSPNFGFNAGLLSSTSRHNINVKAFLVDYNLTFKDFPITLDDDINVTVDVIESYNGSADGPYFSTLNDIATKYGLTLDALISQQRTYLQNNGYIK